KYMLARQVADEAKHARVLAARIAELGGDVRTFQPTPEQLAFWEAIESLHEPEALFAGLQLTVESQSNRRNQQALERFDAATAEIFRCYINRDELFHEAIGRLGVRTYATTPEAQARARAACRLVRERHVAMTRGHHRRVQAQVQAQVWAQVLPEPLEGALLSGFGVPFRLPLPSP
ncbi:MAG: ferritin-like domain-containing protein, partial [Firmicutes bacterium]|nr:ferritin-like domain-containing protein [Bacillota bacterium]